MKEKKELLKIEHKSLFVFGKHQTNKPTTTHPTTITIGTLTTSIVQPPRTEKKQYKL